MFTKAHIVAEIKRTAEVNGGKPLGAVRFEAETGIRLRDFVGKFWARWGDALSEAGFQPNALQGPRDDDDLLRNLALLAQDLGHFPVANEIKLRARSDPGFPWHNSYSRFGNKHALATRLRDYCVAHDCKEVVCYCDEVIARFSVPAELDNDNGDEGSESCIEYVYLLKSGRYFKIGRSNSVGRRERELAIQLPEEAKVVHSIKTDDAIGIEAYWHTRFSDRRKNGEWFELTAKDVAAFKRRKFM